jgi:pilus assembly protein Flp/PilA
LVQVAAGCGKAQALMRNYIMIIKFLRDETGLELSEYAVAVSLVAVATVAAFELIGANIGARINALAGFIQ